jgi:hypothetical protein
LLLRFRLRPPLHPLGFDIFAGGQCLAGVKNHPELVTQLDRAVIERENFPGELKGRNDCSGRRVVGVCAGSPPALLDELAYDGEVLDLPGLVRD